MKKILLTGILSILLVGLSFSQARFGVTAGLNASNLTLKDADNSDFKAGFQAGLVADFAIAENFSFMPELLFSQRGGKSKVESTNSSVTLNYLQLPLNLAYKFDAGYGSKVFIFAGPYLGYGISGTSKYGDKSDKIDFGSKEGETKPLDFGLNAGIGYQYEKIFFKLQCNPGFANLSNDKDASTKNFNVAISVGYFFN